MDMIRWYNDIIYNINSTVFKFVVVESSRCSSKTLQKGSCPYAPLDEALRYTINQGCSQDGDPAFAPATGAPVMISWTTKS